MPRLILHIGTHKTGTTSIQNFMGDNAKLFAEQGVYYPMCLGGFKNTTRRRNGHVLDRAALKRSKGKVDGDDAALLEGKLALLKERMAGYDTVVLSDERIWCDGAARKRFWQSMRDLVDELGFDGVKIVLYLRRQDKHWESRWKQYIKVSSHEQRDCFELLESHKRYWNANYYGENLETVERLFGRENVTVRIFEREKLVNGDAVDDFLDACGLRIDERFTRRGEANPSLTYNVTEVKRIANMSPLYKELNENVLKAPAIAASEPGFHDGDASMFSEQERDEFLAQFEAGNERVAREYFGISGDELFDRSRPDPPKWEYDCDALLRDAIMVFGGALAQERAYTKKLEATLAELRREFDALKKEHVRLQAAHERKLSQKARRMARKIVG